MTHVIALEDGQSSQGTSQPITPGMTNLDISVYNYIFNHLLRNIMILPVKFHILTNLGALG